MARPFTAAWIAGQHYDELAEAIVSNQIDRTGQLIQSGSFAPHMFGTSDAVLNMLVNPMIEDPASSGWTLTGVTNVEVDQDDARYRARVTVPGATAGLYSDIMFAHANKTTYGFTVKLGNFATASRVITILIREVWADGSVQATTTNTVTIPAFSRAAAITVSRALTVSPFFQVGVQVKQADGWTTNNIFEIWEPVVSVGAGPHDFFASSYEQTQMTEDTPSPYVTTGNTFGARGSGETYAHVNRSAWLMKGPIENLHTNPYALTNLNGRAPVNASESADVTQFFLFGTQTYMLTATAANATDRASITVPNGVNYIFQALVFNTNANTRTCELQVGGVVEYSTSVAARSWEWLRTDLVGTGAAVNFDVVWTNSVNLETFAHWFVGVQVCDYFAPPSPPLNPSGSIVPNYATWSGVAHASTSEEPEMIETFNVGVVEDGDVAYLSKYQGAVYVRIRDMLTLVSGYTPEFRTLVSLDDEIILAIDGLTASMIHNSDDHGEETLVATVAGSLAALATSEFGLIFEWSGSSRRLRVKDITLDTAVVEATDNLAESFSGYVQEVTLGNLSTGDRSLNGMIAGVLFGNRWLTDAEFDQVNSSTLLSLDALSSITGSRYVVRKISSNRLRMRVVDRGEIDG